MVAEVKPGGKSKRELASEIFMYPIGIMDAAATYPTWLAAYEVAVGKPGEFKTEQDRIEYADMIVRTTQPTASPKDLAAVQEGVRVPAGHDHVLHLSFPWLITAKP